MNIVSMLVIYNDEGEILLQDRKSISRHGENRSFFGGHLEDGETPQMCLIREIKEELDLDIKADDYNFLGVWNKNVYQTNKNYDIYFYLYKTDKKSWEDREGSGAKFWTLDEAQNFRYVADFADLFKTLTLKMEQWKQSKPADG